MLQNKIRQSTFTLDRILARMRTQKAKVFDQTVIPAEMVKEHNDIYKLSGSSLQRNTQLKTAQMCSNNFWAGTKD